MIRLYPSFLDAAVALNSQARITQAQNTQAQTNQALNTGAHNLIPIPLEDNVKKFLLEGKY